MLNPARAAGLERIGTALLPAAVLLVPLSYSPALADPFAFPKRLVLLAIALLSAGLALVTAARDGDPARVASPVRPIALLFLAAAALAALLSFNRGLAAWGWVELAAGYALFAATLRWARTADAAATLFRTTLVAAAVTAIGCLAQMFFPGAAGGALGSILPPGAGGFTFGDPGLASQFLALALPIGAGAAALSGPRWRQACGVLLGLVLAALVFIGRPEGWVAGGVALLALAAGRLVQVTARRRWTDLVPDVSGASVRAVLLAGIVVLLVVAVSRLSFLDPERGAVMPLHGTTLLSPTSGSPRADRLYAVPATLALALRHPLGVGPDLFRHAFLEVAWTHAPKSPFSLSHQAYHAGNAYAETASETGLLGGVLFVLLVAVLLAQGALASARAPAPWDAVGVTAFGVLALLAAMGLFAAPYQEPLPWLLFWVTAGLVQAACLRIPYGPADPARRGFGAATVRLIPLETRPRGVTRRGRAARAALWVVVAIVLGAWSVERARASAWTLTGQAAFYAGQYRSALVAFDAEPARRSPEHLPRALAGSSALRLGLYEQAVREFDATLARSPWFVSARLGRGAAEEQMGHWDDADTDYREALRLWPDNPDILLALAGLDTSRGRLDQALDDYRRVMAINPGLADTYFRMGELFLRRNQVDEAIEAFRVCGMKNPKYPRMRLRLGDAFFAKGLQEMALRYYQAAAGDDDKDVETRLRIANALHALDRPCEALDSLQAARDLETRAAGRAQILDLIAQVEPACRKAGGPPRAKKK